MSDSKKHLIGLLPKHVEMNPKAMKTMKSVNENTYSPEN